MSTILRQMPLVVFLFFTAIPTAMAGIFVFAAWRARRQAAAMRATPTSNIGMAADGYCEFEGRAEAISGELVKAPLTLTPCVWYHAKVFKWQRSSSTSGSTGHWATLREYNSSTPFLLRDATGVCIVDPWRAEVTPSDKSQWYGTRPVPTDRNPPRVDPHESVQPTLEVGGKGRYKYYEERIYADSPLLVLGEFTQGRFGPADAIDEDDEDDEEPAPIEAAAQDVEQDELDEDDEPGDELPDEDEAVADRLEKVARTTTRARISRGTGKKPFVISTKLQAVHVATSEMGSQAANAMALAFLGVAALMLWARFG